MIKLDKANKTPKLIELIRMPPTISNSVFIIKLFIKRLQHDVHVNKQGSCQPFNYIRLVIMTGQHSRVTATPLMAFDTRVSKHVAEQLSSSDNSGGILPDHIQQIICFCTLFVKLKTINRSNFLEQIQY